MSKDEKSHPYIRAMGNYYVLYCVLIILVAIGFHIWSSSIPSEFSDVTIYEGGQPKNIKILQSSSWQLALSVFSAFLFTLAGSIFITFFIIRKLDRFERGQLENLRDSIKTDVFESLFERLMPEEIFTIIRRDIITSKIIRKNADWIFDFSEIGPNTIQVRQTISYDLCNVSNDVFEHTFESMYLAIHQNTVSIEKLSITIGKQEIAYYDDKGTKAEKNVKVTNDGNTQIVRYLVTLDKNETARVTFVNKHIYRTGFVQDEFFTRYPIINLNVTFNFMKGWDLVIYPAFSSSLHLQTEDEDRRIYKLTGGILPFQGIVYLLSRVPSAE